MAVVDARMLLLVPHAYALRCWRALPEDDRYDYVPHRRYIPARYARRQDELDAEDTRPVPRTIPAGHCQVCGAGPDEPCFVRLHYPVSHQLFGAAICCPRCWPAPFGDAPGIVQGDDAAEIAALWERSGLL